MPVKRQGVISGSIDFANADFVEIFDVEYKYLYGQIDDLFVQYGNWVEYHVVPAPKEHPMNCKYVAIDIEYVDVKRSCAPTSDEFRSNNMDVRDFNKVDFFQFDSSDNNLTHKSTIQRDRRDNKYFNSYYGAVSMNSDAHRRLLEHRIDTLDVMMTLVASKDYKSGPHWEVVHFIHQGKCYSINGYLSITGHVLRGPKGVVRNRCEVTVPPDSLRPRAHASFGFGGSPLGSRGLGARATSGWSLPKPSETIESSMDLKKTSRIESTRAIDEFHDESSIEPSLNEHGRGWPNGNRAFGIGFGRSSQARPQGLGRLADSHF